MTEEILLEIKIGRKMLEDGYEFFIDMHTNQTVITTREIQSLIQVINELPIRATSILSKVIEKK